MPPKAKASTVCGASRKNKFGAVESCTQNKRKVYDGGPVLCPERDQHISPLVTGSCHAGWHEGTKAKDHRGHSVQSCQRWMTCPCQCHTDLDSMFTMSERERTVIDNSGYVPPKSPYVMPTLAERALASVTTPTVTAVRVESAAPGVVPATIARTYAPTTSGRAARGELEAWTHRVCADWLVEGETALLTPPLISKRIAANQGLGKAPSTGAITACLYKWRDIGYAEIGSKPLRFLKFTPDGVELGLEAMKLKAKDRR